MPLPFPGDTVRGEEILSFQRSTIFLAALAALVCVGAPARAKEGYPAPKPTPQIKDPDRTGKCNPNQLLMPDGSCESRGGLRGVEGMSLPAAFSQSHELDAITGMDTDDPTNTSDLEEVEFLQKFNGPNEATHATMDCPLRPSCRYPSEDPKTRCLSAGGMNGNMPAWVGFPKGGLEDPADHPVRKCGISGWPTEAGCIGLSTAPDPATKTVRIETVGFVDLLAESYTCIELHGDIRERVSYARAGSDISGSRLSITGTGDSEIKSLEAFEGTILLKGIGHIGEIKRSPKVNGKMPKAKRRDDILGGGMRIEGPASIDFIDYHGQLSLKKVFVDRLVLDGELHLDKDVTIRTLHIRTGNQFYFGTCERNKGCKGKIRVIDVNGVPTKTY